MKTYNQISKEGQDEIKELALDILKWYEGEASDLHHYAYNEDYFIIGNYEAEQWLIKHIGVFNAIEAIREYEQDQFGEVTTDLSSPEKVVNMLVYIAGEELLFESSTLQDKWNTVLTHKDCEKIAEELNNA